MVTWEALGIGAGIVGGVFSAAWWFRNEVQRIVNDALASSPAIARVHRRIDKLATEVGVPPPIVD